MRISVGPGVGVGRGTYSRAWPLEDWSAAKCWPGAELDDMIERCTSRVDDLSALQTNNAVPERAKTLDIYIYKGQLISPDPS